jgi:hypothetical protein
MAFPDPIVAGDKLIVPAIESADYHDGGSTGWAINRDGSATFNDVNIFGDIGASTISADTANFQDISLTGYDSVATQLANLDPTSATFPAAKGLIALGRDQAGNPAVTNYTFGTLAIRAHMDAGRAYKISLRGRLSNIASTDDLYVHMTYTTDNTIPARTGNVVLDAPIDRSLNTGFLDTSFIWEAGNTYDYWISAWIQRASGAGAFTASQFTNSPNFWEMYIEDIGLNALANTPVSYYANPTSPPPPATKTYTSTYYATWSRTYDGDSTTTWDDSAYCYQGYYSSTRGNTRSIAGFDYATIQSNLSGATINSIKMTVKGAHAYWNAGMIFEWGTHNYTAKPSTWSGTNVNERRGSYGSGGGAGGLAAGQTKTITLANSIGTEFQNGTSKGLAFGPGPTNSLDYYGYIYGATQTGKPYLTITYTK